MKKVTELVKNNFKNIIAFIIGITITTTVYGITQIQSDTVGYNNTTSGFKDSNGNDIEDVKTAMDELYTLANNQSSSQCQNGYTKQFVNDNTYKCVSNEIFKVKAITLNVGDVVKMTPTLNTFTTNKTYTGASSTQTINPQLLNIWRVIRVNNENGTITYDAVSEYASAEKITFGQSSGSSSTTGGKNAYKYFISYLNTLASKYRNDNYTVGSRCMGYNGQTATLTSTSYYDGSDTSAGKSWKASTSSSTTADEPSGRGDVAYTTDLNLVKEAYNNSAVAYKVDTSGNPTTTPTDYWLASRYYYYKSSSNFSFNGRYINASGSLSYNSLRSYSGWSSNARSYSLRPIIVLKSDLTATGLGTLEYPYVLQ